MKSFLHMLLLGCAVSASAAEVVVPLSEQVGMNVTIYNENRALIKDKRRVKLNEGINELAFRGVSANMMPQTALLQGPGLTTREQNFNFDLLTKEALLQKSVGHIVTTEYIDPATGKQKRESAELLAYNGGHPVLKIDGKIETDYPGRIIFDLVPQNLRAEPTLIITANADKQLTDNITLNYLTTGLSWKADYVARLNADEELMDLNGFVTLTNHSGADYKDALLQLVAGDVNTVREEFRHRIDADGAVVGMVMKSSNGTVKPENLADFYLYTIPHKTNLLSNQTKQVALLSGTDIKIKKTYEVHTWYDASYEHMKPEIYLTFKNEEENKLGQPLPKGVIRVYKEDAKGNTQFLGEDRISHIANKEEVRLHLGQAFNLSLGAKRVTFKKVSDTKSQGTYEITFKNGGTKPANIDLITDFPDNYKLMEESQKSERVNSNTLKWRVTVPAKDKTTLTYRVQIERQ